MDCSKSSYFEESKKYLFKDTFTCTIKVKKCVLSINNKTTAYVRSYMCVIACIRNNVFDKSFF